jgi:hypothetical protein
MAPVGVTSVSVATCGGVCMRDGEPMEGVVKEEEEEEGGDRAWP